MRCSCSKPLCYRSSKASLMAKRNTKSEIGSPHAPPLVASSSSTYPRCKNRQYRAPIGTEPCVWSMRDDGKSYWILKHEGCLARPWRFEMGFWGPCTSSAGRRSSCRRARLRGLSRDLCAEDPMTTACLRKDREKMLTVYQFQADHWPSLRATSPIESTIGTIRHRTARTKGCLTHDVLLHMIFKLWQCAEKTCRCLRGFQQLEKVIAGFQFTGGIQDRSGRQVITASDARFGNAQIFLANTFGAWLRGLIFYGSEARVVANSKIELLSFYVWRFLVNLGQDLGKDIHAHYPLRRWVGNPSMPHLLVSPNRKLGILFSTTI